MKDFPQGFVIGAALVLFAWFATDGHRREQLLEPPPPSNFDRYSFNGGVLAGSVATSRLTQTPPLTNADTLMTLAWHEWTNNMTITLAAEKRYREFRRGLARTSNDNHIRTPGEFILEP